jgi:molybdopterin synthase catalytic subunit
MDTGMPNSGRSRHLIALRTSPISVDEAFAHVNVPTCGGCSFFVGTVRPDATARGPVEAIEYEAYEGVAESVLARIADEAVARWGVQRVAVLHRTGTVPVGGAAVIVAVGAAHRAEALAATRYCIDELKRRAPLWKREIAGGHGEWVSCTHAVAVDEVV